MSTIGVPGAEEHWIGGRRPSMRPPPRIRSRLVVGAVALGVGFLAAVQAAGPDQRLSRLAAERPEDLTRILADLNAEADALARQVSSLRVRVLRYRGSARSEELALRDARKSLADLQVLSGVVPVQGPGLTVRLDDAEGRIGWDLVLDLVQELRDAGAEAIAVNGRRVVASTWFGAADGGILVGGGRAPPPYELQAIGSADGLAAALAIPGGPLSVARAFPGVSVTSRRADGLSLPAAEVPAFQQARPAA